MPDYDDKSYYEVQLEQKQLVLILLLMVAICVLFFFLGVYYARGREPVAANGAPRKETPAPDGLKAPEGPGKVETEQVSRFFETGGSKEGAAKAEYEGGRVVAESLPSDPPKKTPPPKATPDSAKAATPERTAPATTPKTPAATPRTPAAERKETPPPAAAGGSFIVQVAAMKEVERANKMRNDLTAKGFKSYLETQDTATGEKLYKIRVGPFRERSEAEQAKDALRADGHTSAFVSGE